MSLSKTVIDEFKTFDISQLKKEDIYIIQSCDIFNEFISSVKISEFKKNILTNSFPNGYIDIILSSLKVNKVNLLEFKDYYNSVINYITKEGYLNNIDTIIIWIKFLYKYIILDSLFLIASEYIRISGYSLAEELLALLIKIYPNNINVNLLYARLFTLCYKYEQSIQYFDKYEKNLNRVDSYYYGLSLYKTQRYEEAKHHLIKCNNYWPLNYHVYELISDIYLLENNYHKALFWGLKCVILDDNKSYEKALIIFNSYNTKYLNIEHLIQENETSFKLNDKAILYSRVYDVLVSINNRDDDLTYLLEKYIYKTNLFREHKLHKNNNVVEYVFSNYTNIKIDKYCLKYLFHIKDNPQKSVKLYYYLNNIVDTHINQQVYDVNLVCLLCNILSLIYMRHSEIIINTAGQQNMFSYNFNRSLYLFSIKYNKQYKSQHKDKYYSDKYSTINANDDVSLFEQSLFEYFFKLVYKDKEEILQAEKLVYMKYLLALKETDNNYKYLFSSSLGQSYYGISDYNSAIEYFDIALESDNQDQDSYYFRARCYEYLKKYSNAIYDYSEYIKLNPFEEKAYRYRSECKFILDDYYGAIEDLNVLIKRCPVNAQYYIQRGDCWVKLKQKKKALLDFSKAGELGDKKAYEKMKGMQQ